VSEHRATVEWRGTGPDFLKGKYSRDHVWKFDGGVTVPASAALSVVPAPYANPANVDPEEAFVAAIASCHMLTFLHVARKDGFQIESYEDNAVGLMSNNERGVPWVSSVALNPKIVYGGGKSPSAEELARLHHLAHEQCFIANSVKTEIVVSVGH
jgi:organic hydroperoxide reductase OsmC/OhrA